MNSLPNMGLLHDQIRRYLQKFRTEASRLTPLLNMVADARLIKRSTLPGHVTASGIIINDNKMLMIFHPYLEKWLQPGGHIESMESPLEAAAREVVEETGLTVGVDPWHQQNLMPFDIDVHVIPENRKKREPEHLHFDFRYLLKATPGAEICTNQHHFGWIDINAIEEAGLVTVLTKLHSINN